METTGPVLVTTLTARTTSASNNATITCRIDIGGTTVQEHTARGPHAVADRSTMPHGVLKTAPIPHVG